MRSRDPSCVPRANVEQGGRLTSRQAAPIRLTPPASPTVGFDPIRLYPTSASSIVSFLSKDPRLRAIPGRPGSKTEVARVTTSASHRAQWTATGTERGPGTATRGGALVGRGGAVSAGLSQGIADAKNVDCSCVRNNFHRVATHFDLGSFVFHRPLPRAVSAAATSIWYRAPLLSPDLATPRSGARRRPRARPSVLQRIQSTGATCVANPDVHHPI